MEDQSNPRVQAHAAAALINFTEDCPKSLLIPYLDSLVQHLHVIMVAKLQEVQINPKMLFSVYCHLLLEVSYGLSGVLSVCFSVLPVDPKGHQTGPRASGDVHCLSGRHS